MIGDLLAATTMQMNQRNDQRYHLNWRTGEQWLPGEPTNLHPLDGSTIWAIIHQGRWERNDTTMNWTSSVTNETRWIMEYSIDPSFTNETTHTSLTSQTMERLTELGIPLILNTTLKTIKRRHMDLLESKGRTRLQIRKMV